MSDDPNEFAEEECVAHEWRVAYVKPSPGDKKWVFVFHCAHCLELNEYAHKIGSLLDD